MSTDSLPLSGYPYLLPLLGSGRDFGHPISEKNYNSNTKNAGNKRQISTQVFRFKSETPSHFPGLRYGSTLGHLPVISEALS